MEGVHWAKGFGFLAWFGAGWRICLGVVTVKQWLLKVEMSSEGECLRV